MATITPTTTTPAKGVVLFSWGPMLNTDVGAPVQAPSYPDKTIHVTGTFGVAGNCRLQGTAETAVVPASWQSLTDPQGNILDVGVAKVEAVQENVHQYRPNITAGDGTTSLTVLLYCRGQAR